MAKATARRFGVRDVRKGNMKGRQHIATARYKALLGEIIYLEDYLNRRLLPQEPEDRCLANILLALQNTIEREIELVIAHLVSRNATESNLRFLRDIETGFVSFKTKFTWAHARGLILVGERDIMEQIRLIRNAQTHRTCCISAPTLRTGGLAFRSRAGESGSQLAQEITAKRRNLRLLREAAPGGRPS